MGIEPTAQAWEAWVLPLYDARAVLILFGWAMSAQISPDYCRSEALAAWIWTGPRRGRDGASAISGRW
jgi:hypothetical protein